MKWARRDDTVLPVAGLVMSALCWGIVWYPYRWLAGTGMDGLVSSMLTYIIAGALGLPLLAGCWRNLVRHTGVWIMLALLAGVTNTAYVLAVIHGEVMRVALLFYLAPLWTVLFARLLLGERLTVTGYLILLLSLGGALVMLWRPEGRWPLPVNLSEWLGLLAGIGFALTNVLSRRLEQLVLQARALAIWAGGSLVPAVWLGLLGLHPLHGLHGLGPWVWLVLVAVALSMYSVTLLMQYGLSHVAANRAIVILLSELVVSALSAYLLAHEWLVGKEWLGAAMIMAASLFSGKMEHERNDADSGHSSRVAAGS